MSESKLSKHSSRQDIEEKEDREILHKRLDNCRGAGRWLVEDKMTTTKPREFVLWRHGMGMCANHLDGSSVSQVDFGYGYEMRVIEYSAYEQKCKDVERLRGLLNEAINGFNRIVTCPQTDSTGQHGHPANWISWARNAAEIEAEKLRKELDKDGK